MAFTYFFRDTHTLGKLVDLYSPKIDSYQEIKIWNAGCAMGPETYTFAIILAQKLSAENFNKIKIDASDLNGEEFGKIITKAEYSVSELQRVPKEVLAEYFNDLGNERYAVIDRIKNRVNFRQHDLLTLQPFGSNYNIVICKNVLLHFQPPERIEVIKMYHKVLLPGGIYITEQTQKLPEECSHLFRQLTTDANIYEKIG